jgi:hypothetical protein
MNQLDFMIANEAKFTQVLKAFWRNEKPIPVLVVGVTEPNEMNETGFGATWLVAQPAKGIADCLQNFVDVLRGESESTPVQDANLPLPPALLNPGLGFPGPAD